MLFLVFFSETLFYASPKIRLFPNIFYPTAFAKRKFHDYFINTLSNHSNQTAQSQTQKNVFQMFRRQVTVHFYITTLYRSNEG